MSELTIKQMIDVAIQKELPVPDEATGLILYEHSASLVSEDEFGAKAVKVCSPSDKQMEIINNQCLEPQDKENWMIIKGINPLGIAAEPDAHSDVFSKAAERDMAKQAFWTPILTNHDHQMNPPIGRCLEASAGKEGLRETWAIPKASYNAEYREAILHGNMPEISVGAFIEGKDKLCNSCGDGKSIYSVDCPHIPGRQDPKTGQKTTVTINRVQRYAERSLVNIPARLGTSVKGLAPDLFEAYEKAIEDRDTKLAADIMALIHNAKESGEKFQESIMGANKLAFASEEPKNLIKHFQIMKKHESSSPPVVMDLPLDYEDVYLQILVPEGKDLTGANGIGIQNFVTDKPYQYFKFSDTSAASSHLLQTKKGEDFVSQIMIDHRLFPDNESVNEGNFVLSVYCSRKEVAPPATIAGVINEDSIVAEKDVKAPEAQEPSEKEEIIAPEAPAAEDKTEAPVPQEEIKSVEVPVVKSLEVEELTKSFTESLKMDLESVNKTLADTNEAIKSFKELQDGQGAQLKTLVDAVASLAEQIIKLQEFSTEEAVNKLMEVVGQIKEQTAPAPASLEPKDVRDVLDMLRK